jgi:hypothetical protein
MPTTHKSRHFQPLSNSENSNEKLVNDEQKKHSDDILHFAV